MTCPLCIFNFKKKKKSEYAIDRCFHHAVLIVINHLYKFYEDKLFSNKPRKHSHVFLSLFQIFFEMFRLETERQKWKYYS